MANANALDHGWLDEESPTAPSRPHDRVTLRVEVNAVSESQFFAGLSGDVTEGGVFVQTHRRLPAGERVALVLVLPAGEIEALGVVDWLREADASTSPGAGVVFERLTASAQAQVKAFCESRPPLYPDIDTN
jgi:uncharacterized protein (TIGR02266 family)